MIRKTIGLALDAYAGYRLAGSSVVARFCQRYLKAYYNNSVEMDRNGEAWLVERLTSTEPHVAVDAGANRGDWAALWLRSNPNAQIYAFEPVPATYEMLVRNIRDERLKPFKMALSDKNGAASFFAQPKCEYSGMHHNSHLINWMNPETIEVKLQRGDDFFSKIGVTEIRMLKIDTEGHDLSVMRGFGTMLIENVQVVQFEYNFQALAARIALFDFYELLQERFHIGRLLRKSVEWLQYEPSLDDFRQTNYVAVRKGTIFARTLGAE
jgi:FkbM family methyltransferase